MKKVSIYTIVGMSLILGGAMSVFMVKKDDASIVASDSDIATEKTMVKNRIIANQSNVYKNSESEPLIINEQKSNEEVIEFESDKRAMEDFELGLALTDDVNELLETVLTLSLDSTTHEALAKLYRLSIEDSSIAEFASKTLLNEIKEVKDIDDLNSLYSMLTFLPSSQVTSHAFELLSSENVDDRRRAYSLLAQSKDADPGLVLSKVWSESETVLASYAVTAIGERNDIIQRVYEPEIKEKLTAELNVIYASHELPEVRAAALTQISLLDNQNDDSRRLIESALDNNDPNIMNEAIMAITRNEYYSNDNKLKLLSIAMDSGADKSARLSAHDALAFYSFNLQDSERHQLIEIKKELDQLGDVI